MIRKILIAEDHESSNISVQKTLEDIGGLEVDYVYYCDDALSKIKLSQQHREPYDLLITDLYFEDDGRVQRISNGTALIDAARQIQPDLRVLVFSAEAKAYLVESLFQKHGIDGFVRKARNDAKELRLAIEQIAQNQQYFPRHLSQLIKHKNTHDFSDFDIAVIGLLAQGVKQKDIPDQLRLQQIKPSGLSSVEKRLNHIKETFAFSNNEQLVAFCKDMGLI